MIKLISGKWFHYILLGSITFIVFFPSTSCELTNWDSTDLIATNLLIRSLSFENLKKIFGSLYWYNYQPLTLFSFALEYHFFKINPFVIHLDNIILHACNALLVYRLLYLITAGRSIAFVSSLLWAIHPMRVESVTWAVERKDVLYSFFFLLALIQYLKYLKTSSSLNHSTLLSPHSVSPSLRLPVSLSPCLHYSLSLLFFILACLAKGMAVSLTLILPVIDYFFRRLLTKQILIDKIPYLCISLFFGILVLYAAYSERVDPVQGTHHYPFERLIYAAYGIVFYINKFFYPLNLSTLYPYCPPGYLPVSYMIFPLLAVCLIAFALFSIKFTRKVAFGTGFYFATVFFVLQYNQTYAGPVADHYSYMGHIGLSILAGWTFEKIYLFRNNRIYHGMLLFCCMVTFIFLGLQTRNQIKFWKNSITLWEHALETNKSPVVLVNIATAYEEKGNNKMAMKYYNKVFSSLKNHEQKNSMVYNGRGNLKLKLSDYSGALSDLRQAIEINPKQFISYLNMGAVMFELTRYDTAVVLFNKAISLNPDCDLACFNKGNTLVKTGKTGPALNAFDLAIQINPYESKYFKARGNLFVVLQKYEKALMDYNYAIDLDSTMTDVYYNRANVRWVLSDHYGACADWKKAEKMGFADAGKMIQRYCIN